MSLVSPFQDYQPVAGGGGGGTGAGTIIDTGPYTDLTGWQLLFNEGFATTVATGSMFTSAGSYGKGVGNYTHWGAENYLTTYGSQHGTGDYYGLNNMGVVSGVSGATGTGNVLQMDLKNNDGTGKRKGCCPFPNISGTAGTSASSSGQLYGRVEARFKATSTSGWKTAWLFWPTSWSWTNELDFPEGSLNGTIQGYVHQPNNASVNAASYTSGSSTFTSWHTAATEWTSTGVKFILDGVTVLSTSTHPSESMFWQLQTENNLGSPQPTGDATVWVDSVGVWKKV
jgi:hypothetical protein